MTLPDVTSAKVRIAESTGRQKHVSLPECRVTARHRATAADEKWARDTVGPRSWMTEHPRAFPTWIPTAVFEAPVLCVFRLAALLERIAVSFYAGRTPVPTGVQP
jgi:hypothetical protein